MTVAVATAIRSNYCRLVHGGILAASYYLPGAVVSIVADDSGDALDAADAAVVRFARKGRPGGRADHPGGHRRTPRPFGFTITEFSVHTGKPIRVLYQRRTDTGADSTAAWWVNTHGTAMIATQGSVVGVQTPTTFTPLPLSTQCLFARPDESLHRLPAW